MGHPYNSWWIGSDLSIEESRAAGASPERHHHAGRDLPWSRDHVDGPESSRRVCVPDDLARGHPEDREAVPRRFISGADWTPSSTTPPRSRGTTTRPSTRLTRGSSGTFLVTTVTSARLEAPCCQARLKKLAREHGTPCSWWTTTSCARNYATFKKGRPRVQAYYAVKANPDPAIVKTLYRAGASFDVASMPEFMGVYENIKDLPAKQRQDWIWDKIIYANPIKAIDTLRALEPYKPLVTYDNQEEIKKIKKYAPHAGVALRLAAQHGRHGGALLQVRAQRPGRSGPHPRGDAAGLVVEG